MNFFYDKKRKPIIMLCKYSILWRLTDLETLFFTPWIPVTAFHTMWLFNYLFRSDGVCGIIATLLWHDIWFSSFRCGNISALSAPAASIYRQRGVFVHEGKNILNLKRKSSHANGSELPLAFHICWCLLTITANQMFLTGCAWGWNDFILYSRI